MKKITVVTAFFDIGREFFKNTEYTRSNEQYFRYFEFWARMRNDLIVYTTPEFVRSVQEIRAKFGLEKNTRVIEIENPFELETNLYRRMQAVGDNSDFREFRLHPNAMENRASYDYVMLLKYWCMADAVRRGLAHDLVAWIDFGFNHGGRCFPHPEEFDFEWQWDFTDKVHVFSLREYENASPLVSLQFFPEIFMGAPLVAAADLCNRLWELMRQAMQSLVMVGAIDDDQQLLLMAYHYEPQIFEIHLSEGWFLPLKECGAAHLTAVERKPAQPAPPPPRPSLPRRVIRRIKRELNLIPPPEPDPKQKFFLRLETLAEKYDCIFY